MTGIHIQKAHRYLFEAFSLGLLVLLLAGCSFEAVDIQQEQASSLADELLDGGSFGQTFTPQHDGLSRVDLYTATSVSYTHLTLPTTPYV